LKRTIKSVLKIPIIESKMKTKESGLYLQKKLNHVFFQPFYENLYGFSLNGVGYGYGGGMKTNGELKVIDYLKKNLPKSRNIFFDVGANIGEYSFFLFNSFKTAKIYSFEPSLKTFNRLVENVKEFGGVKPINIGLGDKNEKRILYIDDKQSSISTLHNRKVNLKGKEEINIMKLDTFCKMNDIDKIDFLKMDVEGNEFNILLGAREMLKNRKIYAIQFEFGIRNIDSKTFFRDFWDILNKDYEIYRVFNKGICKIDRYSEKLEIFTGMNYFCILKLI